MEILLVLVALAFPVCAIWGFVLAWGARTQIQFPGAAACRRRGAAWRRAGRPRPPLLRRKHRPSRRRSGPRSRQPPHLLPSKRRARPRLLRKVRPRFRPTSFPTPPQPRRSRRPRSPASRKGSAHAGRCGSAASRSASAASSSCAIRSSRGCSARARASPPAPSSRLRSLRPANGCAGARPPRLSPRSPRPTYPGC